MAKIFQIAFIGVRNRQVWVPGASHDEAINIRSTTLHRSRVYRIVMTGY
ncbi:MAG: hypothetical protein ABR501_13235 [Pyrinomonadaceae bacterium]